MSPRTLAVSLIALIAAAAGTARAAEPAPVAPVASVPAVPVVPVVLPGRQVVVDSTFMLSQRQRDVTVRDLDPEQADIIREINRRPGTWHFHLLATSEDLPDRFFHPGFPIRFRPRRLPVPPAPPETVAAAPDASAAPLPESPDTPPSSRPD